MLTRRLMLAAPLARQACAAHSALTEDELPEMFAQAELHRAVNARGGGERALASHPVLTWTGSARIRHGGDVIEIGVDTVVEPFTYARSRTWLASQGPEASRSLEMARKGGWRAAARERPCRRPRCVTSGSNNAIYGLMRLITLTQDAATAENASLPADAPPSWHNALLARHPSAPPTLPIFDRHPYLVAAENIVDPPEDGGAPIRQRFLFVWPRTMRIEQNGRLFFELTLDTLHAASEPLISVLRRGVQRTNFCAWPRGAERGMLA